MSVIKWKFNGEAIDRNPDKFTPTRQKQVEYRRLIDDNQVRVIPPVYHHTASYDIGWSALSDTWRNKLYDWYINDDTVTIESHIQSNPRERWTVKIDEFTSELRHSEENLWSVQLTVRSMEGVNDPILRNTYQTSPGFFVIDNTSNRAVHDITAYIQAVDDYIQEPFVTQTYLNLLQDPGFESMSAWNFTPSVWVQEIVHVAGSYGRSTKSSVTYSSIYQETWCPPGEYLTAMCYARGDEEQQITITLEYRSIHGDVLGQDELEATVGDEWIPVWFTTDEPTPEGTARAVFGAAKTSENNEFLYIDQALLRLGKQETLPTWTNHKHRTIQYKGSVPTGDILRINMMSRQADINSLEHVNDLIDGESFSLPVGKSLVVVFDPRYTSSNLTMPGLAEQFSDAQANVVIRYDDGYA